VDYGIPKKWYAFSPLLIASDFAFLRQKITSYQSVNRLYDNEPTVGAA
jgi:hypothetical protein